MFDSTQVVPAYQSLIGWRQHWDTGDINLPSNLTTTDTGEYYQQKHQALQLDVIKSLLPSGRSINEFLETIVQESTNEMLNDLLTYRKVNQHGKTLLEESTLLDRYGWTRDQITNKNRFVGMQIKIENFSGLKALITEIGLQWSIAEDVRIYLFHSSQKDAIANVTITATGDNTWNWKKANWDLVAFSPEKYHGGVFVVGYYQSTITGNAINYSNFNWQTGYCGGCNNPHHGVWKSIRKNFHVHPLYVPEGNFKDEEMFDLNDAIYTKDESFGLNFKFSARCDLTDFFVQNRFVFKNLLAHKVTYKVLQMMKFSQQINAIEENMKHMIIRDLEGDIDTKLVNVPTLYDRELKAVSFDMSAINAKCLPCEADNYSPTYGVV